MNRTLEIQRLETQKVRLNNSINGLRVDHRIHPHSTYCQNCGQVLERNAQNQGYSECCNEPILPYEQMMGDLQDALAAVEERLTELYGPEDDN